MSRHFLVDSFRPSRVVCASTLKVSLELLLFGDVQSREVPFCGAVEMAMVASLQISYGLEFVDACCL